MVKTEAVRVIHTDHGLSALMSRAAAGVPGAMTAGKDRCRWSVSSGLHVQNKRAFPAAASSGTSHFRVCTEVVGFTLSVDMHVV